MMASFTSTLALSQFPHKRLSLQKSRKLPASANFKRFRCFNSSAPQWEPAPISYASEHQDTLPKPAAANIFETLNSPSKPPEPSIAEKTEHLTSKNLGYLRIPLWLLGPAILLLTGMVPTLWLPVSSIFPGPTVSGLLSLTGLDCIFNLGAFLFLLMADSAARAGPKESSGACKSRPPLDYRVFNVLANITGFAVPLLAYLGSENGLGLLQPRMGFVPFAVMLGPYLLLLTVQMLTEMLTWQWGSPVWLVAPVVYEGYRLLQLMRGLGLGPEMGVPAWTVHMVRGLVCGWVLVFGVQLMRVAWYAGFTASGYRRQQEFEVSGDG
ncbi:Unknown protein [Striga hermonthica]|uniref:Transmembrane protein n=1 Tax=Striga hermonthica TaxID=68872 RepID=A0A9N7MT84_STRHE|nr:Unknown protein [Striga hermonthica]